MTVRVELDEAVAADVLVLVLTVAEWGDEWAGIIGRGAEAIAALRDVLPVDLVVEARVRVADAALIMAAAQDGLFLSNGSYVSGSSEAAGRGPWGPTTKRRGS